MSLKIPASDHPWSLCLALRRWYVAWKRLASKAIDGNALEAQPEQVTAKNGYLPSPQNKECLLLSVR